MSRCVRVGLSRGKQDWIDWIVLRLPVTGSNSFKSPSGKRLQCYMPLASRSAGTGRTLRARTGRSEWPPKQRKQDHRRPSPIVCEGVRPSRGKARQSSFVLFPRSSLVHSVRARPAPRTFPSPDLASSPLSTLSSSCPQLDRRRHHGRSTSCARDDGRSSDGKHGHRRGRRGSPG